MEIEYLGHSSFLLTASDGTRIVTDPYTQIGYEMPNVTAEYVICSHGHFDHSYVQGVSGKKEVVCGNQDVRCGAFRIRAVPSYHDEVQGAKRGKNTIYIFEADGLKICHMGDIGEPCSEGLVQKIGSVDILMIPIGGTYTVDAKGAMEYIRKINPKVAVAMHFCCKDCALDFATADELIRLAPDKCVSVGYKIDTKENSGKILIPTRKS